VSCILVDASNIPCKANAERRAWLTTVDQAGPEGPPSKPRRIAMLYFAEGFTFRNFLADAFAVFMFVLWFWLLIIVISDLFRRHDVSGWVKAIWVIALIVFPYLGIFAYMITQSRGMAERSGQQAQQAREELRRAVGFSAADEIEKLDRLKKSGSITDQEFTRLRAKLVA
jgi:Phospholipase_D-nuclease N-terminal